MLSLNRPIHFFLSIPYHIVLAKLKFFARLFWGYDVWPRHSFLTDAFAPGFSDLDLSVYASDPNKISSFLKFYSLQKKLFPFLGEIFVYDPINVSLIKTHQLNGFELERDPIFLSKFNITESEMSFKKSSAAVFLFQTLLNDFHKIEKNSYSRLNKWKNHFEQINHKLRLANSSEVLAIKNQSLLLSICTAITNLIPATNLNEAQEIRLTLRTLSHLCLQGSKDDNFADWVQPLFQKETPNNLIYSFFIEYFCSNTTKIPILNSKFESMLESQIELILLRALRNDPRKHPEAKFFLNQIIYLLENSTPTTSRISLSKKIDAVLKYYEE